MRPVLIALLLALVCVSGSLPLASLSHDIQSQNLVPASAHLRSGSDGPATTLGPVKTMTATRSGGLYGGLIDYSDVMLIVNNQSSISRDIGAYFKSKRNLPDSNVIYVNVTPVETIDRNTFNVLRSQIEENLTSRGLTNVINYLVTTTGVPLRVSGTGNAAVDSELSLILGPYSGTIGNSAWTDSPVVGVDEPITHANYGIYMVTRLTGYTMAEAKNLVDLADASYRSDGLFAFDAGGPYSEGENWIIQANQTVHDKGYTTSLDTTSVFQMNYKDVIGYCSWGSNGQGYGSNYVPNSGFETDSSPADGVPDGWATGSEAGSIVNRSADTKNSGTYSAKMNRPSVTGGESWIGHNITIMPGARYWVTGCANLSAVTTSGGAYMFIRAYDAQDKLVAQFNGTSYTGTRLWFGLPQMFYEPIPGVSKVMVGGLLSKSSGIAYFDDIQLHVIKPNNTWVPGSIGETFVSTGGRSFAYGTGYGQSLVVDLVREGISGVSGHVYEPYLTACARPYIMFDRYTDGFTMAECFYMSLPCLSWMEVVVGDPKMCPYFDNRPDLYADQAATLVETPIVVQGQPLAFSSIMRRSSPAVAYDPTVTVRLKNATNPDIWSLNATYDMSAVSSVYVNASIPTDQLLGDYDVVITVDSLDKVRECNESNNTRTISAKVIKGPKILSSNVSAVQIYRGHALTVSINVSDPQTAYDQLNVTSKFRASGLAWTNLSMSSLAMQGLWSAQLTIPAYYPLGYYDLEFNLTNGYGLEDHLQLPSAFCVLNNIPAITDMTVAPMSALRNGSCELTVACLDVEDAVSNMTAQMRYSLDGSTWAVITNITKHTGAFIGKVEFSKLEDVGDVDLKAKVCDSDGAWSEEDYLNGSFSIVNQCPSVEAITVSKDMAMRGESVDISVTCFDLETQISELNLTLEYKKGSQWNTLSVEYKDEEEAFRSSLAIGKDFELKPISFRASAKDPSGGSCVRYLNDSVLVRNSPPQIETFTSGQAVVARGEGLNVSMTCSDYEDPIGLLTAECEFIVGNASAWTAITPLTRTTNGFIATLTVPTTTPLADMTFRVRPFDKDTYGMVNQQWDYPTDAVKVINNVPSAPMLSIPANLNSSCSVSIDVTVLASDIEDASLTVILNWSLDGSNIGGSMNLSTLSKVQYGGKVTFNLPEGAGPFYVSYKVMATDKDGGDSVATYPKATKISKTGGSSVDDDTDDDTTTDYTMVYLGLGAIILVLVALIIIVALVVLRRKKGEKEARTDARGTKSHEAHPAALHRQPSGQVPVYSKPPSQATQSKSAYSPEGPSDNMPIYNASGPSKPKLSKSSPVMSKPSPASQPTEGPDANPDATGVPEVDVEDTTPEGSVSAPELEPLTEAEPPAEEVEFDELDELVDFDDE